MKRTKDNIRDPLFRFFEREVNLGAQLVQDMRRDLQEVGWDNIFLIFLKIFLDLASTRVCR